MAVIEGGVSAALVEVDSQHLAARASLRPAEALGQFALGLVSGAVTGAAAGAALFSLRNIGANPLLVRRVGVGCIVTTAFTTAQAMRFGLGVARAFTVSDSGGTAAALTGSEAKLRTSLATPSGLDVRIASTTGLTAGTKTLDANRIGVQGFWAGAIGATLAPQMQNLFLQEAVGYPLVLAQNGGINIINEVLMGAAGVASVFVNIEFAEAAAY